MDFRQELLGQEVVYEQFQNSTPQDVAPQAVQADSEAITGISSNTLTVGGKVGSLQNVELPQALGAANNPTFNTVNFTDPGTTRSNLGLGGLATQSAAAASADTAPAQGVAYSQVDVQAILDELRNLKTVLRAAGILTP